MIRDFIQNKDMEYNKNFSSMAKYATIHLICALCAIFNLFIDQMYVVIAISMDIQ